MSNPKHFVSEFLPRYFLEQYPQFVKFIEEYYDFIESGILVLDDNRSLVSDMVVYGSMSKAKAIIRIVADDRVYFEYVSNENNFYKNEILLCPTTGELFRIKETYKNIYSFLQDIEDNSTYQTSLNIFKKFFRNNVSLDHSIFKRVDPKLLTKRIIDYYKHRGTESSIYWFFKIFFDEQIDLYFPKVDILKLSKSDYKTRRWLKIDIKNNYTKFDQARIYSPLTGSSAIVRDLKMTSVDGVNNLFLDLVFVNGDFQENSEIIAFDYITGEELIRSRVQSTVIGVDVLDGGIGHKVGDRIKFNHHTSDGLAVVKEVKPQSVGDIVIKNSGFCYRVGQELELDNQYTGATNSAKFVVDEIDVYDDLSTYLSQISNLIENQTVDSIGDLTVDDLGTEGLETTFGDQLDFEVGSIKSIRVEKSGTGYKFPPTVIAKNDLFLAGKLKYFDIVLPNDHSDFSHFVEGVSVNVMGNTGIIVDLYENETATYSEIADEPILAETFTSHRIVISNRQASSVDMPVSSYMDETIGSSAIWENGLQTLTPFILSGGVTVQSIDDPTKSIEIQDVIRYSDMSETAEIECSLVDGVSRCEITSQGLYGLVGDKPIFYDELPYVSLHADLTYRFGTLFDRFGTFIDNGGKLSWDKHIRDGYYYQDFSYEIRTKIPAEVINDIFIDEIHPAGFIAFVQNKFDNELKTRLLAFEYATIEIEAFAPLLTDAYSFVDVLNEGFYDIQSVETLTSGKIETSSFTHLTTDGMTQEFVHIETFLDDFLAFQAFLESTIFTSFEKTFHSFEGYLDDYEYYTIFNETVLEPLLPAITSYMTIQHVHDSANFRSVPIRYRAGEIASVKERPIANLRAIIEGSLEFTSLDANGGVLVVRDEFSTSAVVASNANAYTNHGYLPTAEVLTRDGWIKFENLYPEQEVAHIRSNGKILWTKPENLYIQSYNDLIYTIKHSSGVELSLTKDTELVIFDHNDNYKKIPISQINFNDNSKYIGIVDDLTQFHGNLVSRKIPISDFEVTTSQYTGLIYISALKIVSYENNAKAAFNSLDILLSNIIEPKNFPKFIPVVKPCEHEIYSQFNILNTQDFFDMDTIITDELLLQPIHNAKLGGNTEGTIPRVEVSEVHEQTFNDVIEKMSQKLLETVHDIYVDTAGETKTVGDDGDVIVYEDVSLKNDLLGHLDSHVKFDVVDMMPENIVSADTQLFEMFDGKLNMSSPILENHDVAYHVSVLDRNKTFQTDTPVSSLLDQPIPLNARLVDYIGDTIPSVTTNIVMESIKNEKDYVLPDTIFTLETLVSEDFFQENLTAQFKTNFYFLQVDVDVLSKSVAENRGVSSLQDCMPDVIVSLFTDKFFPETTLNIECKSLYESHVNHLIKSSIPFNQNIEWLNTKDSIPSGSVDEMLLAMWISPFIDNSTLNYIDLELADRDFGYLQNHLKINYTVSEGFVYDTTLLNSISIIDVDSLDSVRTLV